jgi:plasmid stabilization system protein ParE
MKVRWTEVAFTELNEIHSYIAKDNPAAAKTVVIRIEQVVARLARFPHMAGTTGGSGIRVFPALPSPTWFFTRPRAMSLSFAISATDAGGECGND